MTVERNHPDEHSESRTTLRAFLDSHRSALHQKIDGVTDEQARATSIEPSELSLLGLLRHMHLVEQRRFERWFAGSDRRLPYVTRDDRAADFHCEPDDTIADALAAWQAQRVHVLGPIVSESPDHGQRLGSSVRCP